MNVIFYLSHDIKNTSKLHLEYSTLLYTCNFDLFFNLFRGKLTCLRFWHCSRLSIRLILFLSAIIVTGVVFGGISSLVKHWSDKSIRLPSGSENKKYTNAVFDQIYGGSLSHDFKIWSITFQGSGPSGPILFSCEKISL